MTRSRFRFLAAAAALALCSFGSLLSAADPPLGVFGNDADVVLRLKNPKATLEKVAAMAATADEKMAQQVRDNAPFVGVLISTGSLKLTRIVMAQEGDWGLFNWFWLPHLPMVVLFFVSATAETNRPPFGLPEAESELVAGYQVEYSSTPFLLFMIGEYLNIVLMCAMLSILFLGGWHLPWGPIESLGLTPFWTSFAAMLIFYVKIWVLFFMFAMVKAIVPRYRYDQLMRLGWKIFLPTSLVAVAAIAYYVTFMAPAPATSVAGG